MPAVPRGADGNQAAAATELLIAHRGGSDWSVLDGHHALRAACADLLRRLGRGGESRAAYDRAIDLAGNPAERAYLARRRGQLAG